jgi:AcrR family transcriptional regulator
MKAELPARDALLQAAKSLLWECGYQAMSPRDVLARSGVGQGSLYHHFSGKQALALAALDEIAAEEIAALEAILLSDAPPLARVRDYLLRERQALRGCRLARLANESAIEEADFRRPIARFLTRIETLLEANLSAAQRGGDLPPGLDADKLAATLLAVVEGGFVMARVHWDAARMRAALDGAVLWLDALGDAARQR